VRLSSCHSLLWRGSIRNLRSTQTQERLTNALTKLSLMTTEKKVSQDTENSPNFCASVIDISLKEIVMWKKRQVAVRSQAQQPLTIYSLLSLFWKTKGRLMRSPCSLYITFRTAEPIFIKLGMYIMASQPISTAYFINPSHQSVCICIPLSLLSNSSAKRYRGNE
jgi:hypothetical protein